MIGRWFENREPGPRPDGRAASAIPLIMALEPRLMFDGAAAGDVAEAAAEAGDDSHSNTSAVEPPAATTAERHEVAFIDPAIADDQTLVAGLPPGVEVVVLDGTQDGLAQMAEWAATHSGYDAVHVFSHGAEGQVRLGTETLTAARLAEEAVQGELARLGGALSPDGDILLYGCDVGADGAFLDRLAALTDADVAASTDATGAAAKGGDWALEATVGAVETPALPMPGYDGVLAATTFDFEANVSGSGSMTLTQKVGGETLKVDASSWPMYSGYDRTMAIWTDPDELQSTLSLKDGKLFDLTSIYLKNNFHSGRDVKIETDKGYIIKTLAAESGHTLTSLADLSGNYFKGISYVKTQLLDYVFGTITIDNVVIDNIRNANTAAPVLADQSPTLSAIDEDVASGANAGTTVAAMVVDGSITDADGAAVEAVAISAVDNTRGTWQYKQGGGAWTAFDFTGANAGTALLLDASDGIRFMPDADWNGTVAQGITFHAWDKSSGSAGSYLTISGNTGGTNTLSTETDTAVITVNPVNDAPTLDAAKSPALAAIDEDVVSGANGGDTVANIVVDGSITDADGAAVEAIAVSAVDNTTGTWQYKVGGGAWTAFDFTGTNSGKALLLDDADSIRFVPNGDYAGTASITFHAWDKTSGSAGSYLAVTGNTGGLNTLSTATDTASVTVNAVNDVPALADGNPTLAAIDEDVASIANTGTLVAGIVVDGSITDPDGQAVEAIAVSAVDTTNGTWEYKVGGGAWTAFDFSGANNGKVLLLDAADSIRFVPNADWNGTVANGITFHAWDKSAGHAGDYAAAAGGMLSATTDTASITVKPVNDVPALDSAKAPALSPVAAGLGVPANGSAAGSTLVSAIVGTAGIANYSDVDGDLPAIAVIGTTSQGSLYYTTDGGATWAPVGQVSATRALVLYADAQTRLYFMPNSGTVGSIDDALTFKAWDRTGGYANGDAGVNTTATLAGLGSYKSGYGGAMVASGDYAFMLSSNGLQAVDVTDPAKPVGRGYASFGGLGAGVAISGNYIYVAAVNDPNTNSSDDIPGGLRIIDVSDPAALRERGALDISSGYIGGVTVSGNYAYLVEVLGVRVVDVSNPDAPTQVTILKGYDFRDVAITGSLACVAADDNGLVIFDVSNPGNPSKIGTLDTDGTATGVAAAGHYVYLAEGAKGLRVVDISDPAHPVLVATYATAAAASDLTLSGDYAYVTTASGTVEIIDISVPAHPQLAATVDGPAASVAVANGRVLTAGFDKIGFGELKIASAQIPGSSFSTDSDTVSVVINAPPTISMSSVLQYTEGDGEKPLDETATVSDADSKDFDTGTLTVSIGHGDTAEDVLAIRNQGTGQGQVGVSGSDVTYGGVVIGTFAGGSGGNDLVVTFNANASPQAAQAVLRNVTYRNSDADSPTAGKRAVRAVLTDGDGGSSEQHQATVTVTAVNDAPVFSGPAALPTIYEDVGPTDNTGASVAELIVTGAITDADGTAVEAIAVTAVDNSHGTWEYSAGNGQWTAFDFSNSSSTSSVAGTALLLDSSYRLRFVPATNWHGTLDKGITFHAWDKTSGSAGHYLAVAENAGGSGTLSETAATASITVVSVNDRPRLASKYTPVVDSIAEDREGPAAGSIAGATKVTALIVDKGEFGNYADADFDQAGIAITEVDPRITLYYTIDGGKTWQEAKQPSLTSAVMLYADADTYLHFKPKADFSGTLDYAISFRAWDRTGFANGTTGADVWIMPSLAQTGVLDTAGRASDVTVVGTHAYVADSHAGLQVIDVSDAVNPKLLGTCDTFDAVSVAVGGGYAYVADNSGGLKVIDVSDPGAPTLVGTYQTQGKGNLSVVDVSVQGSTVAIVDTTGTEFAVRFIDVSDPAKPTFVSDLSSTTEVRAVAVDGNHAYVVNAGGVVSVDISNPKNLGPAGALALTGLPLDIDIRGGYAYVASFTGGVQVVDISDPANLSLAATYAISGRADSIAVVGDYAYVTIREGGLLMLDVSDPTHPRKIAQKETDPGAYGVAAAGNFAYVANDTAGLRVFSLSMPVSRDFDMVTVDVTPINDAPVLDTHHSTLTDITEDDLTSAGDTVAAIVGKSISDVDDRAARGIAIVDTSPGTGIWQYSVDGGATWTDFGKVSSDAALLLRAEDKVRLVPDGRNGATASFGFHAWDQTSGTAGKNAAVVAGGTNAFSTGRNTATIAVGDVNDAPTVVNAPPVDIRFIDKVDLAITDVFADVDTGDTLSYKVKGLPAWLSFDPRKGTFSGTPPYGTHSIHLGVTAYDSHGAHASIVLTMTVTRQEPAKPSAPSSPQPPPLPASTAPVSDNGPVAPNVTVVRDVPKSDKPDGLQTVVRESGASTARTESGSRSVVIARPADQQAGPQQSVAPVAGSPGSRDAVLVVNTPIKDAVVAEGSRISVTMPPDAFASTQSDARLTLTAQRADGAALPGWMSFNPRTATFEGTPPPGFKGEVLVKVVARDAEGREAIQTFKIVVGKAGQGNVAPDQGQDGDGGQAVDQRQAPAQTTETPPRGGDGKQATARPAGRPSLTDQLRAMSQESRMAKQMAMFGVKRGGKAA